MFRFDKEQLVIDIAGVKMGGQPGEYPTVLAGTIFYGGHNIISDEKEGIFDKDAAEERIKTMEEMSDVTGNPCVVQTFGATAEAMVKYLEFVGDVCDKPFLIDSTAAAAKIAGVEYVQDVGLAERAVYNSISMAAEPGEIEAVKNSDIDASILLGRGYKKEHKEAWPVCDIGSNIVQQMAGGDFVLFGPIENARLAFPACGMADIMIAEAAKDIGTEPIEEHPINNLL